MRSKSNNNKPHISKIKLNKKALIFSIATIFLLFSILTYSKLYFTITSEYQKINTDSLYGEQMRYFEDDILQDIYWDVMQSNITTITKTDQTLNITFYQELNDTENDYEQYFADYKNYIEKNYSNSNYNFTLSDFNSEFNITPHNLRYHMNDGRLYIYTTDIENLNDITINVFTDQTISDGRTTLADDDGNDDDYVPIYIYVYGGNVSSSLLISSQTTREQNPYEDNDPFQTTWKDTPNQDVTEVNVEYGTYNGIDGVLQIYMHNENTDYNIAGNAVIKLNYNYTSEVQAIGAILTQNSIIGTLNKSSRFIIKKE